MKRFIAAVSFAALAVPAFAAGLPYEQNVVDRALPNIEPHRSASSGDTQTDRGNKSDGSSMSPWANDYNFIAPAP